MLVSASGVCVAVLGVDSGGGRGCFARTERALGTGRFGGGIWFADEPSLARDEPGRRRAMIVALESL